MAERFGDARTPHGEGQDTGDVDIPLCVDSCGRPATDERLVSAGTDPAGFLVEVVELCCIECSKMEAT